MKTYERETAAFFIAPLVAPFIPWMFWAIRFLISVEIDSFVPGPVFTLLGTLGMFCLVGIPIAYLLTVVLVLPLYLILKNFGYATNIVVLFIGFLVGASYAIRVPIDIPMYGLTGVSIASVFCLVRKNKPNPRKIA